MRDGKYLILYAEDDKELAELYIDDFHDSGYDVIWAKNGLEAVALYKKHSPDIDLVLLDIDMPGLDGYQVAEEIRKTDLRTPVIFLTLLPGSDDAIRGLDLGADDYIRKDINNKELLARVRRTIQRGSLKQNPVISITPDTRLDMGSQILTSCGYSQKLSFRDVNLLHLLFANKNNSQKREWVISQIWKESINGKEYMNKSISNLRKLMSKDEKIQLIANRGDSIMLMVRD
ncbi:MAG: response regulator transcription factor [Tannerella sp.]|jgi:DNA-binding response OmpR family regulator|nr:response regulator transcription factor [Tannerella sp.]